MEENVLNEELDTDVIEDTEVEDEPAVTEDDDEFEYDDEGNIIIPDVEFDPGEDEDLTDGEDTDEEAPEEESDEEDGESEEVPAEEQKAEEDSPEEVPPTPDPRDEIIKDLRNKLDAVTSQAKDTLKKLGSEKEDVIDGLVALAAEAAGKDEKEYREERDKEQRQAAARQMIEDQMFEIKAQADLKELHAAYPETQKYKHVKELPENIRGEFGRFRDLGLSAKQAYAAANPDGVRSDVAASVKRQAMHESKAHLVSSVPKSSKNDSVTMSKAELASWREMFPDMSDAEILKLYKQSK